MIMIQRYLDRPKKDLTFEFWISTERLIFSLNVIEQSHPRFIYKAMQHGYVMSFVSFLHSIVKFASLIKASCNCNCNMVQSKNFFMPLEVIVPAFYPKG
jgi:hypothetical protein